MERREERMRRKRVDGLNEGKGSWRQMKEHLVITVTTLAAMAIGAFLGVIAYYHGWLG